MSPAKPATDHDARSVSTRIRHALWRHGKAWRQRLRPRPVARHVFVDGLQRSGTHLLMDVLDASAAPRVFHETDPRAFERYEMRDPAVIRQLALASPAPAFVIKAPCELDRIPGLMTMFAPARTLWRVRDWRGRGMPPATRERLPALYRPDASEADGAAIMRSYRNVLFFDHQLARDPRVRGVFYEALVEEPMREVAALCDELLARFKAASGRGRP